MRKVKIAQKSSDVEKGLVTFAFTDGTKQVINVNDIPKDLTVALMCHAVEQKGGDSYASASDPDVTDGAEPVAWAKAQCQRVLANLIAGIFNARGPTGPGRLAQALAEAIGISVEKAVERLNDWKALADGDDEKMAKKGKENLSNARNHPKVKAILARMEKEALDRKIKAMESAPEAEADDLEAMFE